MKNIEIPFVEERGRRYRFFEMLPGLLSWSILALPFLLAIFNVTITLSFISNDTKVPAASVFVIAYLLLWFCKAVALNMRSLQGFRMLQQQQKLPWGQMLKELQDGKTLQPDRHIPTWHYENIRRAQDEQLPLHPDDLYHAIIIATYNEAREILEPTVQSVLASDYDMKRVIFVLAFEERGGEAVEKQAHELINDYKVQFKHAFAVKHPDKMPGEVIGKGGNINYAGRALQQYVEDEGINPLHVIVTTLDADNRPHKHYLNALTYVYSLCVDPKYVSFQPIPVFTNNIWDVPAPMRVIATGNTLWNVVLSLRPHMIRNFSSHAQSLATLIDTDFWSGRTIVEDGHQFWRTYFRYDGHHDVYPIYLPIYQDAVLSRTLRKTIKAQFVQIRRWAWGASDVAYVLEKGFFTHNKVPKLDLIAKFFRLLEGHVSWATAPLLLTFAGYVPLLFNQDKIGRMGYAANQLPHIASAIQTVAVAGILVTLFLSLKLLPPRPARYRSHRTLYMIIQWVYLPLTTICFSALAALNSQTRLIFGRYLGKFDVTDKAVITDDKRRVM